MRTVLISGVNRKHILNTNGQYFFYCYIVSVGILLLCRPGFWKKLTPRKPSPTVNSGNQAHGQQESIRNPVLTSTIAIKPACSFPFIFFCYLPIGWGGGVAAGGNYTAKERSAHPGMWAHLRWLSSRSSRFWDVWLLFPFLARISPSSKKIEIINWRYRHIASHVHMI